MYRTQCNIMFSNEWPSLKWKPHLWYVVELIFLPQADSVSCSLTWKKINKNIYDNWPFYRTFTRNSVWYFYVLFCVIKNFFRLFSFKPGFKECKKICNVSSSSSLFIFKRYFWISQSRYMEKICEFRWCSFLVSCSKLN